MYEEASIQQRRDAHTWLTYVEAHVRIKYWGDCHYIPFSIVQMILADMARLEEHIRIYNIEREEE